MLDNKIFVNIYVLSLDKNFEIFLPINEKVGNALSLLKNNLFGSNYNKSFVLLNLYSGNVYRNNDIFRDTDIKNGTKLMIV